MTGELRKHSGPTSPVSDGVEDIIKSALGVWKKRRKGKWECDLVDSPSMSGLIEPFVDISQQPSLDLLALSAASVPVKKETGKNGKMTNQPKTANQPKKRGRPRKNLSDTGKGPAPSSGGVHEPANLQGIKYKQNGIADVNLNNLNVDQAGGTIQVVANDSSEKPKRKRGRPKKTHGTSIHDTNGDTTRHKNDMLGQSKGTRGCEQKNKDDTTQTNETNTADLLPTQFAKKTPPACHNEDMPAYFTPEQKRKDAEAQALNKTADQRKRKVKLALEAPEENHMTPDSTKHRKIQNTDDFACDVHDSRWNEKFEGLRLHCEKHGNILPPTSDLKYGKFIQTQQRAYVLAHTSGCHTSEITAQRMRKLESLPGWRDSLGLPSTTSTPKSNKVRKIWCDRFEEASELVKQFGYSLDPKLHNRANNWLKLQKYAYMAYKNNKTNYGIGMTTMKAAMLETLPGWKEFVQRKRTRKDLERDEPSAYADQDKEMESPEEIDNIISIELPLHESPDSQRLAPPVDQQQVAGHVSFMGHLKKDAIPRTEPEHSKEIPSISSLEAPFQILVSIKSILDYLVTKSPADPRSSGDVHLTVDSLVKTLDWDMVFTGVKMYCKKHGAVPSKKDSLFGAWMVQQGRAYHLFKAGHRHESSLTEEQVIKLDSLPEWVEKHSKSNDEAWIEGFNMLQHYVEQHHCFPTNQDSVLGQWLAAQRKAYKAFKERTPCKVKMNPSRVKKLESIPGWTSLMQF